MRVMNRNTSFTVCKGRRDTRATASPLLNHKVELKEEKETEDEVNVVQQ